VGAEPSGLSLWAFAGRWQRLGAGVYPGPVDISDLDGVQTTLYPAGDAHAYRGTIRVVRVDDSTVQRLNVLTMPQYLSGVVPAEMPAGWATAAVQAQGVAARTYAAAAMASSTGRAYDICDTTACQVYGGVGSESATADVKLNSAGPTDVRNQILTRDGVTPITAFFSSSNGGFTVSGGASYLPARADGWDPATTWNRTVTGSCLSQRYGRGAFQRVVVLARDGNGRFGGRVTAARLDFADGSVAIGGTGSPMADDSAVRTAFSGCGDTGGLRSSMFAVAARYTPLMMAGTAGHQPGWLHIVTREPDGSLAHRYWTPQTGLSGANPISGRTDVAPGLAQTPDRSRLYTVVIGTNNLLYLNARNGVDGSWAGWSQVGGPTLRGRPAATVTPSGDLHVVAVGTDAALWHNVRRPSGAWVGWESLGGRFAPGTGASATAVGDQVWFAGVGTNLACYVFGITPGARTGWLSQGGILDGDPAITTDAANRAVYLVVRGANHAVYAKGLGGTAWSGLGGVLVSPPIATGFPGAGGVDVLGVGSNGGLYRLTGTAGVWGTWSRVG
jgi:SpoIID/LytB domain protein